MKQSVEVMDRVTITMSKDAKAQLEDEARDNKRNHRPNGSVSEIIRSALAAYKR